jgi:glycosyltransferase involved in cell wall biosynthesis
MNLAGKIYINGRFLTQPNTGVQRYANEIVNQFDIFLGERLEWMNGIQIKCLIPPGTPLNVSWKNISCEAVGINRGNLWEQIDLPMYLMGRFLFSPCNTGPLLYQNQAVTFHDASVFAVPHAYSFFFRLKYKLIFMSLSRLARVIFTDSKFSQKELSFHLGRPVDNFKVIYLAGDHIDRVKPNPEILNKFNLKKDGYYLTVGSQSLHKNTSALCKAIESTKCDTKYVIAGGKFHKVFNRDAVCSDQDNIIKAGYITDEELKMLFLNALGYIFPSKYEGFGLPILEAMHCGCPVVSSRVASLPEVAGDAALFFDPSDPGEIACHIDSLFYDKQLREDLIEKGFHQVEKFNWRVTALTTLKELVAHSGYE